MADGMSESIGDTFKYNPEYHKVADFLGVDIHDREDYDLANKISLIRDYAGIKGKSDSPEDALWAITDIRKGLGVNTQGRTLVNQLYQHMRLKLDTSRANAQKVKAQPKAREEAPKAKNPVIGDLVQKAMQDKKLINQAVQSVVQQQISKQVESIVKQTIK